MAVDVEVVRPHAARSDGAGLPPGGVQRSLPSPAAERSSAQGSLCPVLSECGCGDNSPYSSSGPFARALLPARSHDRGSHAGWIRSASPRGPAARGWPERRGLLSCSCLGFVGGTHTHRSCPDLAAGNAVPYLRERLRPSAVRSTPPWDASSR